MQPQVRVRKFRSPQHPRRHGRSADGIRQTYYDQDIRRARQAREDAAEQAEHAAQNDQDDQDQED